MLELKPCPFCGKQIEQYSASMISETCSSLRICCKRCKVNFEIEPEYLELFGMEDVRYFFPDGSADEIWNRRAEE